MRLPLFNTRPSSTPSVLSFNGVSEHVEGAHTVSLAAPRSSPRVSILSLGLHCHILTKVVLQANLLLSVMLATD